MNRYFDENSQCVKEIKNKSPEMEHGIDDMLLGRSPCVSSALYPKNLVAHLCWNESIEKAQEWMWAWNVCLEGVKFSTHNFYSTYYNHWNSLSRITNTGNPYLKSTIWRQKVLDEVEKLLIKKNILTQTRKVLLAQYYYKDAGVICSDDESKWINLYEHIMSLDKNFVPVENRRVQKLFIQFFGLKFGVIYYNRLKNTFNKF